MTFRQHQKFILAYKKYYCSCYLKIPNFKFSNQYFHNSNLIFKNFPFSIKSLSILNILNKETNYNNRISHFSWGMKNHNPQILVTQQALLVYGRKLKTRLCFEDPPIKRRLKKPKHLCFGALFASLDKPITHSCLINKTPMLSKTRLRSLFVNTNKEYLFGVQTIGGGINCFEIRSLKINVFSRFVLKSTLLPVNSRTYNQKSSFKFNMIMQNYIFLINKTNNTFLTKRQRFIGNSLKGILLVNFPEKEKNFLIKNLAAENKIPLITQSASLLLKDSRNMDDLLGVDDPIQILFDKVKTCIPCICFINNLDSIGKQRYEQEQKSLHWLNNSISLLIDSRFTDFRFLRATKKKKEFIGSHPIANSDFQFSENQNRESKELPLNSALHGMKRQTNFDLQIISRLSNKAFRFNYDFFKNFQNSSQKIFQYLTYYGQATNKNKNSQPFFNLLLRLYIPSKNAIYLNAAKQIDLQFSTEKKIPYIISSTSIFSKLIYYCKNFQESRFLSVSSPLKDKAKKTQELGLFNQKFNNSYYHRLPFWVLKISCFSYHGISLPKMKSKIIDLSTNFENPKSFNRLFLKDPLIKSNSFKMFGNKSEVISKTNINNIALAKKKKISFKDLGKINQNGKSVGPREAPFTGSQKDFNPLDSALYLNKQTLSFKVQKSSSSQLPFSTRKEHNKNNSLKVTETDIIKRTALLKFLQILDGFQTTTNNLKLVSFLSSGLFKKFNMSKIFLALPPKIKLKSSKSKVDDKYSLSIRNYLAPMFLKNKLKKHSNAIILNSIQYNIWFPYGILLKSIGSSKINQFEFNQRNYLSQNQIGFLWPTQKSLKKCTTPHLSISNNNGYTAFHKNPILSLKANLSFRPLFQSFKNDINKNPEFKWLPIESVYCADKNLFDSLQYGVGKPFKKGETNFPNGVLFFRDLINKPGLFKSLNKPGSRVFDYPKYGFLIKLKKLRETLSSSSNSTARFYQLKNYFPSYASTKKIGLFFSFTNKIPKWKIYLKKQLPLKSLNLLCVWPSYIEDILGPFNINDGASYVLPEYFQLLGHGPKLKKQKITLIASTNNLTTLDAALLRPGRFDSIINFSHSFSSIHKSLRSFKHLSSLTQEKYFFLYKKPMVGPRFINETGVPKQTVNFLVWPSSISVSKPNLEKQAHHLFGDLNQKYFNRRFLAREDQKNSLFILKKKTDFIFNNLNLFPFIPFTNIPVSLFENKYVLGSYNKYPYFGYFKGGRPMPWPGCLFWDPCFLNEMWANHLIKKVGQRHNWLVYSGANKYPSKGVTQRHGRASYFGIREFIEKPTINLTSNFCFTGVLKTIKKQFYPQVPVLDIASPSTSIKAFIDVSVFIQYKLWWSFNNQKLSWLEIYKKSLLPKSKTQVLDSERFKTFKLHTYDTVLILRSKIYKIKDLTYIFIGILKMICFRFFYNFFQFFMTLKNKLTNQTTHQVFNNSNYNFVNALNRKILISKAVADFNLEFYIKNQENNNFQVPLHQQESSFYYSKQQSQENFSNPLIINKKGSLVWQLPKNLNSLDFFLNQDYLVNKSILKLPIKSSWDCKNKITKNFISNLHLEHNNMFLKFNRASLFCTGDLDYKTYLEKDFEINLASVFDVQSKFFNENAFFYKESRSGDKSLDKKTVDKQSSRFCFNFSSFPWKKLNPSTNLKAAFLDKFSKIWKPFQTITFKNANLNNVLLSKYNEIYKLKKIKFKQQCFFNLHPFTKLMLKEWPQIKKLNKLKRHLKISVLKKILPQTQIKTRKKLNFSLYQGNKKSFLVMQNSWFSNFDQKSFYTETEPNLDSAILLLPINPLLWEKEPSKTVATNSFFSTYQGYLFKKVSTNSSINIACLKIDSTLIDLQKEINDEFFSHSSWPSSNSIFNIHSSQEKNYLKKIPQQTLIISSYSDLQATCKISYYNVKANEIKLNNNMILLKNTNLVLNEKKEHNLIKAHNSFFQNYKMCRLDRSFFLLIFYRMFFEKIHSKKITFNTIKIFMPYKSLIFSHFLLSRTKTYDFSCKNFEILIYNKFLNLLVENL